MQKITKVKLKIGGLKGADVSSLVPEEKNGTTFHNTRVDEGVRTVHFALEKAFKDLRIHLLAMCGYVHENMSEVKKKLLLDATLVSVICIDGNGIRLAGVRTDILDGKLNLNPVFATAENYENYEELEQLWNVIAEESMKYISGEVKVTDEEIAKRWIESGKEKGFNLEQFEEMSAEEQKEFCQKILEKNFGAVVMMPPDVEVQGEHEAVAKEITLNQTEETVLPKASGIF